MHARQRVDGNGAGSAVTRRVAPAPPARARVHSVQHSAPRAVAMMRGLCGTRPGRARGTRGGRVGGGGRASGHVGGGRAAAADQSDVVVRVGRKRG